jgi:hypothetical protein
VTFANLVLLFYSQLQTKAAVAGAEHYNGMFDCFRKIVKNEGYVMAQ